MARQTLLHGFRHATPEAGTVRLAVEALFDAAEQDSATGGPDLIRRIYPIVAIIDVDGYRELDDDAVLGHVEEIVADREARHPED